MKIRVNVLPPSQHVSPRVLSLTRVVRLCCAAQLAPPRSSRGGSGTSLRKLAGVSAPSAIRRRVKSGNGEHFIFEAAGSLRFPNHHRILIPGTVFT